MWGDRRISCRWRVKWWVPCPFLCECVLDAVKADHGFLHSARPKRPWLCPARFIVYPSAWLLIWSPSCMDWFWMFYWIVFGHLGTACFCWITFYFFSLFYSPASVCTSVSGPSIYHTIPENATWKHFIMVCIRCFCNPHNWMWIVIIYNFFT